MRIVLYILCCSIFWVTGMVAQQKRQQQPAFEARGVVQEMSSNAPVPKVNVEINGGDYTTTNNEGVFSITTRIGDEIIFRHDDFETVSYQVKDQQRITVLVKESELLPSVGAVSAKGAPRQSFGVLIDSAKFHLKKDAKRSIEYVTRALESVSGKKASSAENSIAFETLGDINYYWQQYDLAAGNFKTSLSSVEKKDVRIKLARAFSKNKNYQESITVYSNLLEQSLSNYQKVEVYEGLGDTYKTIGDGVKSVFNYQQALDIAIAHKITPKITDLNSKIAQAYADSGAVEEAAQYFDNSLELAKGENTKRAVAEKNQVADFYNQNQDYSKEIELRSEALNEIEAMDDTEMEEDVSSPLTPQRQNYKIANAYVAQQKFNEAIPYLERSITEAGEKEDLLVEKDATRKLSEVYRGIGDFDKATESYQRYVEVIDELYIKKEQEISQAARFSQDIALKQNRIISLETDRELNESRYQLAYENQKLIEKNNTVQKWIIGTLMLIALLFLYTAYSQFKNVKQQKYANNLLALKSLRTQMNPHFIFNALNSVNSFIASSDERAANKYLSDFSQLMRSVLENSEEDFIPLSKEIELLELYTKLEHSRFQDKFDYEIHISEQLKVSEFVIPPMLLQPYVENAVWHGLRYKEEKGKLHIYFEQRDEETVEITIVDDGIGRKKSAELKTDHQKKQKSKGMGNIKKRIRILNEMYKDKVDVHIEDAYEDAQGTKVVLVLKKD